MKQFFILIFITLLSCNNSNLIIGVVADSETHEPLDNVTLRTIQNSFISKIEVFETKTKNGQYILDLSNANLRYEKIVLELSKNGYETSLFTKMIDNSNDTLFMIKSFK